MKSEVVVDRAPSHPESLAHSHRISSWLCHQNAEVPYLFRRQPMAAPPDSALCACGLQARPGQYASVGGLEIHQPSDDLPQRSGRESWCRIPMANLESSPSGGEFHQRLSQLAQRTREVLQTGNDQNMPVIQRSQTCVPTNSRARRAPDLTVGEDLLATGFFEFADLPTQVRVINRETCIADRYRHEDVGRQRYV